MNISKLAESILKESVEISTLNPKLQNRLTEVTRIYQQIKEIQTTISNQVGDLQKQIKTLEKQATIFEKELIPVLKDLEDHCIKAEGIYIELKSGKRSLKVGYEYLAQQVNSQLLAAAEQAITKAAEFAQSPTITVSHKTAGLFDWIAKQWNNLVSFIKSLKKQENSIEKILNKLDSLTSSIDSSRTLLSKKL